MAGRRLASRACSDSIRAAVAHFHKAEQHQVSPRKAFTKRSDTATAVRCKIMGFSTQHRRQYTLIQGVLGINIAAASYCLNTWQRSVSIKRTCRNAVGLFHTCRISYNTFMRTLPCYRLYIQEIIILHYGCVFWHLFCILVLCFFCLRFLLAFFCILVLHFFALLFCLHVFCILVLRLFCIVLAFYWLFLCVF